MVSPQSPGASQSRQDMSGRFRSWLKHHQRVSGESLGSLLRNGSASLMTWLVIGIALALPAILLVLLSNLSVLSGGWDGNPRINVFLAKEMSVSQSRKFFDNVRGWKEVDTASLISPDDALEEFQTLSGFGDVVLALDSNPLPAVILVQPVSTDGATIGLLKSRLESMEEVESVSADLDWIERLNSMLALGERMVASVSFFLAAGVLLIVGNTIRLAIENRRVEIEVVKLVGGTDAFVRRPFLYLGFWYGFGGALIAWILIELSLLYLDQPVRKLAGAYGEQFSLQGLDLLQTLYFWGLGAILGIFGAWIAVGRNIRLIEP